MRALPLSLVVLALAVATACGSSDDEPRWPEHEQAYLDGLRDSARDAGSGVAGLGDEWLIDFGYAICDDIDGGMAPTEVVQSLEKPDGEETPISEVASPVVGQAQMHLCDAEDSRDGGSE